MAFHDYSDVSLKVEPFSLVADDNNNDDDNGGDIHKKKVIHNTSLSAKVLTGKVRG